MLQQDSTPRAAEGEPESRSESPTPPGPQPELLLPYKVSKQRWMDYFDTTYLPALLERCTGNVSKAAREAELDRAYLFRLLRRHGLKG